MNVRIDATRPVAQFMNLNIRLNFDIKVNVHVPITCQCDCFCTASMLARSPLLRLIPFLPLINLPRASLNSSLLHTRPYSMTRDFDHYKPHLLPIVPGAEIEPDGPHEELDWTQNLDLSSATTFSEGVWGEKKLRVLVLYGSLRERYVHSLDVD